MRLSPSERKAVVAVERAQAEAWRDGYVAALAAIEREVYCCESIEELLTAIHAAVHTPSSLS